MSKVKVKIGPKHYEMGEEQLKALLQIASEQIPFGIYAVRKNNYIELLREKHNSITQLKKAIREYKMHGFKVYANRG